MLRQGRRNKLMTAVLSTLRQVPIYPAGADKPLSILHPTKEIVEASRERVSADQDAVKVLRDIVEVNAEAEQVGLAHSTGIAPVQGRMSIDTHRSHDLRRPAVGLRRAN